MGGGGRGAFALFFGGLTPLKFGKLWHRSLNLIRPGIGNFGPGGTARPGDRLNGFENVKSQLFNFWGVRKLAYFQKNWSVPLSNIGEKKKTLMVLSHQASPLSLHLPYLICSMNIGI